MTATSSAQYKHTTTKLTTKYTSEMVWKLPTVWSYETSTFEVKRVLKTRVNKRVESRSKAHPQMGRDGSSKRLSPVGEKTKTSCGQDVSSGSHRTLNLASGVVFSAHTQLVLAP